MLTDLNTALALAEQKGCAIPAFNVYNAETALGVLFAAQEARACVIVQMYSRLFSSYEAEFLAPAIRAYAQAADATLVFHLDHGADDAAVVRALRFGCTGIMRDASHLPFDQNVAITRRVVEMCHAVGVPVEGELGHIGTTKEAVPTAYTDPEEAARFVRETGVDALAVLVGTAHGRYVQAPVIAIDRIREIKAATGIPPVLHGGSGVPDAQIVAAIEAGVRKVNFGTDVCYSFLDGVAEVSRNIVPVDLFMKEPTQAVKRFALEKIRLLGAAGIHG